MSESTMDAHMGTAEAGHADVRFSTQLLPTNHRVEMFRGIFARNILGMDIETLGERPFRTDMRIGQLPGLNIVWARNSAVRASRTRQLLADGRDGFAFQWSASTGFGERRGGDISLESNDEILIACSEPGVLALPAPGAMVSLTFPREALPLGEIMDFVGRPVPAASPALMLLSGYVDLLGRDDLVATPELRTLAVAHVYDLLALALIPTRERMSPVGAMASEPLFWPPSRTTSSEIYIWTLRSKPSRAVTICHLGMCSACSRKAVRRSRALLGRCGWNGRTASCVVRAFTTSASARSRSRQAFATSLTSTAGSALATARHRATYDVACPAKIRTQKAPKSFSRGAIRGRPPAYLVHDRAILVQIEHVSARSSRDYLGRV